MTSTRLRFAFPLLALALAVSPAAAPAQDDAPSLTDLQEQAFKAAVSRVEPSVVRIETVGGLERVGRVRFGTGPTTGLIVSEDGYIVSSAFNFAQNPSTILVILPDGTRLEARQVATDHSRMLTLLKVSADEPLPVPEAVPESEMRVGQWSIAVGRTFEGAKPNLSVGIVSALERIWGKAIQTDSKVSPVNYGGPLLDVRGRVLGVLVPLSPSATGEVAGVEWYDSGIGFAIPLDHVFSVLPKLKEGHDLHPGILGVNLKKGNQFADAPVIAAVQPNSPAARAGIEAGDRIVEIEGVAVSRVTELKHQLSNRYAGETVKVAVQRDKERREFEVELVGSLDPFVHAFLGILPMRGQAADGAGVVVRQVYAEGPAAGAGLQPGDRITSLDKQDVADAAALRGLVSTMEPGRQVQVVFNRDGKQQKADVTLAELTNDVPDDLPPARPDGERPAGERPEVGVIRPKVPEFENEAFGYVPEAYDPEVAYGLVVLCHPQGGFKEEELLEQWKPLCDRYDLVLIAPKAADPEKWLPTEVRYIAKLIDQVGNTYNLDPTRVVAHGYQIGGRMAFAVAFDQRDVVRGVAAVEAPLAGRPQPADPLHRMAFWLASAAKVPNIDQIKASVDRLREMKFPLSVKPLGEEPRYLNTDELYQMADWIDTLDRI